MVSISIPRRFRGPDHSANGGYAAGAFAARFDGPVEVTLRSPPPLDTPLSITETSATQALVFRSPQDQTLVAEVRAAPEVDPPDIAAIDVDTARRAEANFPWAEQHPYPECFVCGTRREPGDGLCLHPGPVAPELGIAAATWLPHPTLEGTKACVSAPCVWAALDCPSWFGSMSAGLSIKEVLLGRLVAQIEKPVAIETEHVVVGKHLQAEGRKVFTTAALFNAEGVRVAWSKATWIQLTPR